VERTRTRVRSVAGLVLAASLVLSLVACQNGKPTPSPGDVPIIFVHGFYGSGDQYRAMGQYFASNGYPAERILAFDHNSVAPADTQVRLNAFVDATRQRFGVERVHLVGHSMGTGIVSQYLANADNRSKVDKYVLVDGVGCTGSTPPGTATTTTMATTTTSSIPPRPCLAIRAANLPAPGGSNKQTHVESSVSSESFALQYVHFLGKAPATVGVVAEDGPAIRLAGRVQELTVNTPVANTPVTIWQVDPATGARVGDTPAAVVTTDADGFFAPTAVPANRPYEIVIVREGIGTLHNYYPPFVRSDLLLRINTVGAGSASVANTNRGPGHSAMAVVRNREFWHNHPGQNDVLTVATSVPDGTGQPAIDILGQTTGQYVGIHLHDDAATPGQSSLAPLAYFSSQPFQTGIDLYMPAATPPDGTITVTNLPRGDASNPKTINVANWASASDSIVVNFNDWL
jgi:pimeloyl-ACP methyl ester carboxylesterase